MKCANCKNDAFYIYKITEKSRTLYCKRHLPKFLEPLRRAGNLETTEAFKAKAKETRQILNYGAVLPEEPVVEPVIEAVVEEPFVVAESEAVVEESVVEEAPKPKPRKKSKPKVELTEDEVNS